MEQTIDSKRPGRGLLLIAASAALALVSVLFPFVLLLAPALWAYTMFRTRPGCLALFAALLLVPSLTLFAPLGAVSMAALGVLSALCLYLLQKKRVRCLYTAVAVAAVSVACLYSAVCLPGILSGEGAFSGVQAVVDESVAMYRALTAEAFAVLPADTAKLLSDSLDTVSASVPTLVVPVLCAFSAAAGLSNLLFFRLFARKITPALAPMRAFRLWELPQNWTFGLLLMLVGSLLLEWTGADYANGVTAAVNVVVGAPLTVQGLAFVDYLIVRRGGKIARRRVLVYILLGIFYTLVQSLLMMLGCLEQLFRFRDRGDGPFFRKPEDR